MPGRRHDHEGILMWVWYLDRGAALVAYTALWLAALTGIVHNAKTFGALHQAARRMHVPVSVIAAATLLAHVALGSVDAWLVLSAQVPHPAYSDAYLLLGLFVGAAALLLIVTSILAFLDAKRFQRPWDPRTVHALAYGGFVFSTIHAAAVGTDALALAKPALLALTIFLVWVLVLRQLGDRLSTSPTAPEGGPRGDP